MVETLRNNIQKAFEDVSKIHDGLTLELNEDNFKVLYNGKNLFYGDCWGKKDKVEIYDPYSRRYKWVKSYNKIKELIEDNINHNLNALKKRSNKEKLLNFLKSFDYIVENYNIYSSEDNGFSLSPKDYDKIFSIDVIYWEDKGIETYLKFSTWKQIKVEDLEKIDEAKNEFVAISKMVRGVKW
jgi:hypothetical protein